MRETFSIHSYTDTVSDKPAGFLPAIPVLAVLLLSPVLAQGAIPQQERNALVGFFMNLGGSDWVNKTGWLGLPGTECGWYGVTCDTALTSVTGLNLPQDGLRGAIPDEIGGLTNLQTLSLNGNAITGVPNVVGNLLNLQVLELSDTEISGIPSTLANLSQLEVLHISGYWLGGSIPAEVGTLKRLKSLRLMNQAGSSFKYALGGRIPIELFDLTNLESLELAGSLNGGIPAEIGNLTNLKVLNLSGTTWGHLGGSIPDSIGNLRNLQLLILYRNDLAGEIPLTLFELEQLQDLELGLNFLSSIPTEVSRLTDLRVLDWSGNSLRSIPAELGSLTNLQDLELGENYLGSIPAELGQLRNLRTLDLSGNQLGSLPFEFGNLANLRTLSLYYNRFTVNIVPMLANLRNLESLDLSENQMESIPVELGGLSNLEYLAMSFNRLSGSIPSELGNLSKLRSLWLNQNQLSGSIPTELGKLTNLRDLILSGNRLSGSIPPSLGNLTNLQAIWLNQNQLSGTIPASLGDLKQLQTLWLDQNQLSGSIPVELGNLSDLSGLDVSFNHLSGNIPSSLGNLTKLYSLDLVSNQLSGAIPSSLRNLENCSIAIGYNALHTDSYSLINFLGSAAIEWNRTQTIAPSNIFAVVQSDSSTLVSWRPIPFSNYQGRYEVWTSRTSGGPYELAGSTEDKKASSLVLSGLSPGTYVVVRTVTDHNDNNSNMVVSDYSAQITVEYPKESMTLTLDDAGTTRSTTIGSGGGTRTGYATATLSQAGIPYATAVYSYKQNGVTVSEAGVPASPPTTAARLFVDYRTGATIPGSEGRVDIYSGFAIVNRGDAPATITFTLRDLDARIIGGGTGSLAQGAHLAKYVHQLSDILPGFSIPVSFATSTGYGMLDLTSDQPLSVVALRLTINQREETLLTTTPVVDLTRAPRTTPVYFPQLADGGGYTTSVILMNASGSLETGRLNVFANDGSALPVRLIDGTSGWSFAYSILPGCAYVFQTDASPANVKVGWIELTPGDGTSTPTGAGIFQYSPSGLLLTESGIPAATLTTHARVFVDLSVGHDTGLAIANPWDTPMDVSLAAFQIDGTSQVGESGWPVSLRGKGHIAAFADQLIARLPAGFQGVLDIVSASPFAALTLRSLVNERSDFLLTTFPVADLGQAAPFPVVFPQIADGGGYRTEFIFLGTGQSGIVRVEFYGDDGAPVAVGP